MFAGCYGPFAVCARREGLVQDTLVQRLVKEKKISEQQISDATKMQESNGGSLTANLIKLGAIAEPEYDEFLTRVFGVPVANIASAEVDPAVLRLIPADVASRFQVVPLSRSGRQLTVVMANPSNIFALDDIKFITGCEVVTRVASEAAIKAAIDKFYDSADSLTDIMK
jgi:type IV pilus assembly protein PilB